MDLFTFLRLLRQIDMRYYQSPRGVTLIETLIYLGLLMIFLFSYTGLLIQLSTIQARESVRGRMLDNGATIMHVWQTELTSSPEIDITNSVLGTTTSALHFTNSDNHEAILDTVLVPVSFNGTIHTVRRLRYQAPTEGTLDYFTDAETNVLTWQVDAVRTSSGDLSGLNITLEIEVLNQDNGYRQGSASYQTTMMLTSFTQEI
jgi:hypothetical protein